MKKSVALLLAVLLLTIPMFVSADATVIDPTVLNSITAEEETGDGLAFKYTVNATGVDVNGRGEFLNNNAKVQYNGAEVKLVAMGAVVTNNAAIGLATGDDALSRVDHNGKTVLDINAKYLMDKTDSTCVFAVRITNIESANQKRTIYARPYFVVEVDGVEETVYGDVAQKSHFATWCDNNQMTLPASGTDIDVTGKKNRIRVSAANQTVNADGERQVSLTFTNYTGNWITEETNWVQYTAYDANGAKVKTGTIYIGCIDTKKNKTKTFNFVVPDNTVEVKLTKSEIVYWTEWS